MNFFTARPLRGAMRPYVPSGHAIERSVLTIPFPPALITVFSALDRSCPAEKGDPREGTMASALSFLTSNIGTLVLEEQDIIVIADDCTRNALDRIQMFSEKCSFRGRR